MRIAIAADIHGNITALRAVQYDIESTGVTDVMCAGDLALFGPFPDKCIQLVREKKWQSVRGNTDRMIADFEGLVASGGIDPDKPVGQLIRWTRDRIGEEAASYLGALPASMEIKSESGAGQLLLVHGTPKADDVGLSGDDNDQRLLVHVEGTGAYAIVGGHTHKSFARMVRGTLIANAGSVGRSYEGRPARATYVVADDSRGVWRVEIRHVRYDHRRNYHELETEAVPITPALADPFLSAQAPQ